MDEHQRRTYGDMAKRTNQTIADTNRIIKTQRDRETGQTFDRLQAKKRTGENVSGNRSGVGLIIVLAVMALGILIFFLAISGIK